MSSQLTRRTLLAVGLPLVLSVALAALGGRMLATSVSDRVAETRRELAEATVGEVKVGQSSLVLARLDDVLDPLVGEVAATSRLPEITAALGASYPAAVELAPAGVDQAEAALEGVLDDSGATSQLLAERARAFPAILSMVATDANGFAVGVDRTDGRSVYRAEPWWDEAWTTGSSIGVVQRNDNTGAATFVIAVRADVAGGQLGVVSATVDLAAVQAVADSIADPASGLEVVLVATDGMVLAESASGHDASRIAGGSNFLDGRDSAFAQVLASDAEQGFQVIGDDVVGYGRLSTTRAVPGTGIEVTNPRWVAVVEQSSDQAMVAGQAALDRLDDDAGRLGRLAPLAMAAMALLGLVLAAVLARAAARRMTRPIDQLSRAAYRLAEHELPGLLQPQPSGSARATPEPVTVDADTELVDLATAFNSLQNSAVELANDQAVDRNREVATVLVNLGRRNQQLIGRQLRFIDGLERVESNPDTLRNLFVLDQMATRMRRNAESLLVLAGEESPRRGTQPRPIDEVVRAATSEVEEFARVSIRSMEQTLVDPRVVSDLTHLLAELIENATLFSPPEVPVEISGTSQEHGTYTVVVTDRGLGLPAGRLQEANSRIADAARPGTPASSFMGLFVVGRLAARHGIAVRLADNHPERGLSAIIDLPVSCLATGDEPAADVRGSRLHVSGPLTGNFQRPNTPPPPQRQTRAPVASRSASTTPEASAVPAASASSVEVFAPSPTPSAPPQTPPVSTPGPLAGKPAGVAPTTAVAEDESVGAPIPPFRSREARRPPRPDDGELTEAEQRFQVRRRVKRTADEGGAASGDDAQGAATDSVESAEARAAQVRDRLNRFNSGVQAARKQAGANGGTTPDEDPETGTGAVDRNDMSNDGDLAPSSPMTGRADGSGSGKETS